MLGSRLYFSGSCSQQVRPGSRECTTLWLACHARTSAAWLQVSMLLSSLDTQQRSTEHARNVQAGECCCASLFRGGPHASLLGALSLPGQSSSLQSRLLQCFCSGVAVAGAQDMQWVDTLNFFWDSLPDGDKVRAAVGVRQWRLGPSHDMSSTV